MKTKVINFVGSPSVGKSLICALVFSHLKLHHYTAEYIQEYAKMLIYLEKFDELYNQYNVSFQQYKMINSVKNKVEYCVTDSPLLLGLYYNRNFSQNVSNVQKTEEMILSKMSEFDNIYIFLERGDYPFEETGRIHNYEQSLQIEKELRLLLDELNIPYKAYKSDKDNIPAMLEYILSFQ
jgi:uncharacterized protein YozE (UPF0346 family)